MRRLCPLLFVLACTASLSSFGFCRVLFRDEQFAYRDSSEFYYPLYQRVQTEWSAGRWPLWEPEENGGMPLLGNPTAAVLYPGKLVYAALPYAWAARTYTVAHMLLAFLAMLALMRSWETSWTGSALSALSYTFAVPILFSCSNIIFLVGAAWLPLGFRAVDRWLRLGRRMAALELAVVMAVQTLGGDPESAYVLGVCGVGYALGLAWRRRVRLRIPDSRFPMSNFQYSLLAVVIVTAWMIVTLLMARWAPSWRAHELPPRPLPWIRGFHRAVVAAWCLGGLVVVVRRLRRGPEDVRGTMLLGLAGSAILAATLAAAQLIPVLEFTGRSLRTAEGTHDIFSFSLEPARLLGLVWPNVFGDSFHHNNSWFEILPPLRRHASVWVPSLYMGGLTLVLGLGALGFRSGPPWRAWLTAIFAIALCASLGQYSSPLWWMRWVPAIARAVGPHDPPLTNPIRIDSDLRDGDGSVYWLLAALLPGFGQFRFPSKLLTFSTLALAALAGLGWDRLSQWNRGSRDLGGRASQPNVGLGSPTYRLMDVAPRPLSADAVRTARLAAVLLVLGLAGLAFAMWRRDAIIARFSAVKVADLLIPFGPPDPEGAYRALCFGLLHGTVVLALALVLALRGRRWPALAGTLALVAVTADLACANTRFILTVPQALMDAVPKVVRIIEEAERKEPAGQPFRIHRIHWWYPHQWLEQASADRVQEFVVWERDTIQAKFGMPFGIQYTLTEGTTELSDYEFLFVGAFRPVAGTLAPALGLRPGALVYYFPRRGFDLWNARYVVVPADPNGWNDRTRSFASFLGQADRIDPPADAFAGPRREELLKAWMYREDFQVLRNQAVYSRAWVVHDARFHKPITGSDPLDRMGPFSELLFANDRFWNDPTRTVFDTRALAWLDADKSRELADYLPGVAPQPGESVTITSYTPQRVELEAELRRPGLVILADVDYPGWRLTIDGAPAAIYRTNVLMRGAAVQAGQHRLVYTYEPASFYVGRWGSVAGLVVLAALGVFFSCKPVDRCIAEYESS